MAAKSTKFEIDFAMKFLRAAGVKNVHTKVYLITAIIAWKRASATNKAVWGSPLAALKHLKKVAGGSRVLKVLRQYVAASAYEQQAQGVRLITMLALSAWDKKHFGAFDQPPQPDGSIDIGATSLFQTWNRLLGMKHSIPQPQPKAAKEPAYKPPKVKARQPDDKVYLTPIPVYVKPYAAFEFYESRRRKAPPQAGELV